MTLIGTGGVFGLLRVVKINPVRVRAATRTNFYSRVLPHYNSTL